MVIHTERLTLRPWRETDAASLFTHASDPDVGPAAGWPPRRGFAPEAVRAMQRYAFDTLGCKALWCGYYEGNNKSLRVQQKCGFAPHHVERDVLCELMGDVRTECFTYLTCEDWRRRAQCE